MKLEKIVLDGFKSFADKTEFAFKEPITAIVGPNGCGKSNIVDAVKWVLGDRSAKSLRSGQMADVIFGGSSSRKPLGAARVSLLLSNGNGTLPIEADKVEISRKIYKSGESEYSINNNVCRLKDIRELFMDTGIGARAYSIIEQGQVEQLLNSSSQERRAIFEEAAGISKYKAHKNEAARKLERTEQNLLRLADIVGEVQKQLRSVKLQAGKARNYLQYTKRVKELQVNYSLAEFDKLTKEVSRKRQALEQRGQQMSQFRLELSTDESAISSLGAKVLEAEDKLNKTDSTLVGISGKIEQSLQRIEFLHTRADEFLQRSNGGAEQIEHLRRQQEQLSSELSANKEKLSRSKALLVNKKGSLTSLEEEIFQLNKQRSSLQDELEEEKSGIIDMVRRSAQLHNEVQSISLQRDNLSEEKGRLQKRSHVAREELESMLTEKAHHQARYNDISKVLEELEENLSNEQGCAEAIQKQLEDKSKELSRAKETLSAIKSEADILRDMQERGEGLGKAVQSILKAQSSGSGKFGFVDGVLSDTVTVDVKYATAVESALEDRAGALIVNDTAALLGSKEALSGIGGRISFIGIDRIEPFVDQLDLSQFGGVKGRLIQFVSFPARYTRLMWKLLGKTVIVDNVETAVELSGRLPAGYNFVTMDGQTVSGDSLVRIGRNSKSTGLISRRSRLTELDKTIVNITSQVSSIEQQLGSDREKKERREKLCSQLRTAIYETNTEKMQTKSKLDVYESNISKLREQQPLIASNIDRLQAQIERAVEKAYNSKQKLQELDAVNEQRSNHISELERQLKQLSSQQESRTEAMTELKVSFGQIQEQTKSLQESIESLQKLLIENESRSGSVFEEVDNCRGKVIELRREILGCESGVSELFREKDKTEAGSYSLHQEVDKLVCEQRQAEQIVLEKRNRKTQMEEAINQLRVELGQIEVKREDLEERVGDELQMELAAAYEEYSGQDVDWQEVRAEISELKGKIERLGNVNLEAIENQEQLEERNEFLTSQVEDLEKSKVQLQQLINRLNKKSREKFAKTFEEVRLHFQQIFRKLFGGGRADILLEDSEDILDAGIEIFARPPGKETRSISLLSGGEKTLTAIALLFGVFMARPSPFCLLDEVDAALDEANNERFNMLIREFQKNSQFIIITHSKRTMSIADILFGITMQIRGVSKKISVRFGSSDEEASRSAVA